MGLGTRVGKMTRGTTDNNFGRQRHLGVSDALLKKGRGLGNVIKCECSVNTTVGTHRQHLWGKKHARGMEGVNRQNRM